MNRLLEKTTKLPQTTATWQATIRLVLVWIAPKGKPSYRPHLVFVFDPESGVIRQFMMEDQRPAPEAIMSMLANAMSKPMMGAGGRQRPVRIVLDNQALAQALTPGLTGIRGTFTWISGPIDIYLHEGLMNDAVRLIDGQQYVDYATLGRVTDAAYASHPDWVIRQCTKQAEPIMDAGKSKNYPHALGWLERDEGVVVNHLLNMRSRLSGWCMRANGWGRFSFSDGNFQSPMTFTRQTLCLAQ